MKNNRRLLLLGKYASLFCLVTGLVFLISSWLLNDLSNLVSSPDDRLSSIFVNLPPEIYLTAKKIASEVLLNPYFYLLTASILILEKLIPAKKQKLFSVGLWQDFVWLIGSFAVYNFILVKYLNLIKYFYINYFSQFTFDLPARLNLPHAVSFCLGILLMDFMSWLSHVIQHKVPLIWNFHAVHHSQQELNLFTDLRFHFVDALTLYPLAIFTMSLFLIPFPQSSVYYLWFRTWYPRVYHANIKSNFGWLHYILVTPQSHRIHHSVEAKHHDKNFGVMFSFWDRLFKTQYKEEHIYPDTGIVLMTKYPRYNAIFSYVVKSYLWDNLIPFQKIVIQYKNKLLI